MQVKKNASWFSINTHCMFSLNAATLRRFTYMPRVLREGAARRGQHALRKIDDGEIAAASDKVAQQLRVRVNVCVGAWGSMLAAM